VSGQGTMFSLLGKRRSTVNSSSLSDSQTKKADQPCDIAWPSSAEALMEILNQTKTRPNEPFVKKFGTKRSDPEKGLTSEMSHNSDSKSMS